MPYSDMMLQSPPPPPHQSLHHVINAAMLCHAADPFIWIGRGGVYHAIFHNQIENDDERLCGGHAYSEDAFSWTFTGTAFNNTVAFSDGGVYTFTRIERPHLIFGAENRLGPTHLTTGAQFGDAIYPGGDACYTLLQPIGNGGKHSRP